MIQNFVKRLNNITGKKSIFKGVNNFFKFKVSAKNLFSKTNTAIIRIFSKKKVNLNQRRIVLFIGIPNLAKSTFCSSFALRTSKNSSPKLSGKFSLWRSIRPIFLKFWGPYCWLHMESTGNVVHQIGQPNSENLTLNMPYLLKNCRSIFLQTESL